MSNFKFLKTIKDSPAPILESEKKYQTYIVETDSVTKTIAVPLELVEKFDKFIETQLDDVNNIEKYLPEYQAFVI